MDILLTDELTLENVKKLLNKKYELVYIDYRDSLDESLPEIQQAIQSQDYSFLDNAIDEYWPMESRDSSIDYILNELKDEISREFEIEEEDAEFFIDDNREELSLEIEERDESDPLGDLLRNTNNPVCFYDTGVEFSESLFDEEMFNENLELLKESLNIETDKYDEDLKLMLSQASYGGRLVIYFREDVRDLLNIGDNNTIQFKNPMVAIIDTYNGSGDNVDLPGHEFTLPLDTQNIFLDKTIKYNYTYSVCGMYSSWCDCTDIKFLKVSNSPIIEKSSLHVEIEVEELYKKAYKEGGCTFGDMDVNRHKGIYYLNEFPCGQHCPKCGTFWID
jgi:hypothetical protein